MCIDVVIYMHAILLAGCQNTFSGSRFGEVTWYDVMLLARQSRMQLLQIQLCHNVLLLSVFGTALLVGGMIYNGCSHDN